MGGRLTNRQQFRTCFLENITMSLIFLPYVITNYCGTWHVLGIAIGLLLAFLFGEYMFLLRKNVNVIEEAGKANRYIYALRYMARFSILISVISRFIEAYAGIYAWFVVVVLVAICVYERGSDATNRGSIVEALYIFATYPLLIVGAFSISEMEWNKILDFDRRFLFGEQEPTINLFILGVILILAILSGQENILFNIEKDNKTVLNRFLVWSTIGTLLTYFFLIFCTGVLFVQSRQLNSIRGYGVIEGLSYLVVRFDYIVLLILILLVSVTASGYLFYIKCFIKHDIKKNRIACGIAAIVAIALSYLSLEDNLYLFYAVSLVELVFSVLQPLTIYLSKKGNIYEE